MKKRIIALLTLLVLVLSMNVTAMAAAKMPTASLTSAPAIIKRGETNVFTFRLKSNDYPAVDDVFRAKLICRITKGTKATGNAVWSWTGSQIYKLRVGIKKSAPIGKYKLSYTTYYRKTATTSWKKTGKTNTTYFTVKK